MADRIYNNNDKYEDPDLQSDFIDVWEKIEESIEIYECTIKKRNANMKSDMA